MDQKRIQNLCDWLKQHELDLAWLTSPTHIYYLTGCWIEPHERFFGLVVFGDQLPIMICPQLEVEKVKAADPQCVIVCYDDAQNPWEYLLQAVQQSSRLPIRRIGIEKDVMTYSSVERLMSMFPKGELVGVDPVLRQFRQCKEEAELSRIQQAAQWADRAIQIGVHALTAGCTEQAVAFAIEAEIRQQGNMEMAFETIVLFGEKTALPHGKPGDRTLQSGDLVLIDLGVRVDGYCSDITRTFAFQEVDDQLAQVYQTVVHAQQAALNGCQSQQPIGQLDRLARSVIEQAGYGPYFIHRTGHGLGLEPHEAPFLTEDNQEVLQPGMVLTIEPGIYLPGMGGVRIEDDVLITEQGGHCLTKFPKTLQIVR